MGVEENREILDIVKRFMKEMKIEPYDELSHKGLGEACPDSEGI